MMDATRLVAIPEDELRMYQETMAAVRTRTRATLARCAAERAKRDRRDARRAEIKAEIAAIPENVRTVVCVVIGSMLPVAVMTLIMRGICG